MIHALPSLKFLDDNKITPRESLMTSQTTTVSHTNDQRGSSKLTRSKRVGNVENLPLVNRNNSSEENARFYKRKPGAVYGRLKYKYLGKNSEGNRFIKNVDL